MLKPPGSKHLKLKCDIVLSTFAFKFNLRRYSMAWHAAGTYRAADGRVTRYDPISILEIDMRDRRSNGYRYGISIWDMGYRFEIRYIYIIIISIWSSWMSMWNMGL